MVRYGVFQTNNTVRYMTAGEMAVAKAQEAFDWETRIFQERQQSIPIACEIPVIIETRLYDLVKTIRPLMSK